MKPEPNPELYAAIFDDWRTDLDGPCPASRFAYRYGELNISGHETTEHGRYVVISRTGGTVELEEAQEALAEVAPDVRAWEFDHGYGNGVLHFFEVIA